ncbi:hypothetical protein ACE38W_21615 [Chitinophaga sp. Hz27]|uniref:hypothetical protein n=1 Tax=Chitinophaga sp. Hz27 TaxID=3347169 RepID=UPI0035DB1F7C
MFKFNFFRKGKTLLAHEDFAPETKPFIAVGNEDGFTFHNTRLYFFRPVRLQRKSRNQMIS